MKKICLLLVVFLFFLIGCSNQNQEFACPTCEPIQIEKTVEVTRLVQATIQVKTKTVEPATPTPQQTINGLGFYLVPDEMQPGEWSFQAKNTGDACGITTYQSLDNSFENLIDIIYPTSQGYFIVGEDVRMVELSGWGGCVMTKLPANNPQSSEGQIDEESLEFQENLDEMRDEIGDTYDLGGYTSFEEKVWQYCMNRWDYYDNLEGGYAGDKYTDQVFQDAASNFGISAYEAQETWLKVDQLKLGID